MEVGGEGKRHKRLLAFISMRLGPERREGRREGRIFHH